MRPPERPPFSVTVQPFGAGWAVSCVEFDNPMVFRLGLVAQQAAIRLAQRLMRVVGAAEICIRRSDGTVASRFACAPLSLAGSETPEQAPRQATNGDANSPGGLVAPAVRPPL